MVNIVVAEPGSRVGFRGGVLTVWRGRETIYQVGVNEVDALVVATRGVSLSGDILWQLASHGIPVYLVSSRGEALAVVEPVDVNKTAETMIAQASWRISEARRLEAARWFIDAKVKARQWLLRRLAASRRMPELRDTAYILEGTLARIRVAGSLRELLEEEARAGRTYWSTLAGLIPGDLGFPGRQPRAGDPVNRSLDYLYALVRSRCHTALKIAGLNPYMGFMHVEKSGRPSLTLDYMESYRWAAERALLSLLATGFRPTIFMDKLDRDTRRMLYTRMEEEMSRSVPGSRATLAKAIQGDAWRLASALRSDGVFTPTIPRQG
ncbi:MAG: CRISPR-associated endonuclease Cas1 [Desulfurococcales archaeon]|nr:CRISPR-associated endonuclease Cas1 [Desulfurococcales archaeon]